MLNVFSKDCYRVADTSYFFKYPENFSHVKKLLNKDFFFYRQYLATCRQFSMILRINFLYLSRNKANSNSKYDDCAWRNKMLLNVPTLFQMEQYIWIFLYIKKKYGFSKWIAFNKNLRKHAQRNSGNLQLLNFYIETKLRNKCAERVWILNLILLT